MTEQMQQNKPFAPVVLSPRVDITENDKEVLLVADMPGVNEKGVDIDLERNCLTIKGNREPEPMEGFELTNGEFRPAYTYERQFTLGDTIDREHITTSMKDGVLRLTLPKVPEAKPLRIQVKSC